MLEQKHVLINTSVLQSSHKITYIFSASGKFIYSRNHIPSPSSSHRHCWDLWPCPFLSTLSVSDLISLDWRLSALPWPSAIIPCGDWVSPGDAGGVWVGGLRVKCLWTALLENPPARHTVSSCHCRLSFPRLSGVPAAVTPCLLLCPIVRMMAWGWSHLCSGVKCVDLMTVIFHTEDIFSFLTSRFWMVRMIRSVASRKLIGCNFSFCNSIKLQIL